MPTLSERIKRGWNAFVNNKDPSFYGEHSSYIRPDRVRMTRGNERSIVTAIYNRIAMDVSSMSIQHVRIDENDQFVEELDSDLNNIFKLEANIDQTGRGFIQDAVMSMFDEGCVALVPVDTDRNPNDTDSYKIYTMRTGQIVEWRPSSVKVKVYNDRTGEKEEIYMPKSDVAIIENPFYAIMNERNSTLQRLIHKLTLLDIIDEQQGSGKLDLIIQLPYTVKSEARKNYAEQRRKDIEVQLSNSKYGIAYTDSTEHITQLNRPVENTLMTQIEYLTKLLYSQLGLTEEIMNGSANEEVMLNYYNRTVEPILSAFADEMKRKFLTKTARTQKQSIMFFRDPFKLVPVSKLADIADKFTRNEILSTNEVRGIIGFKPSDDPSADELRNKNMPLPDESQEATVDDQEDYNEMSSNLDGIDKQLDELERSLSE